jgi:hypothetical protein
VLEDDEMNGRQQQVLFAPTSAIFSPSRRVTSICKVDADNQVETRSAGYLKKGTRTSIYPVAPEIENGLAARWWKADRRFSGPGSNIKHSAEVCKVCMRVFDVMLIKAIIIHLSLEVAVLDRSIVYR